ncbi:MAG: hypothetical protein KAQ83_04390, partial [Nanoarchaeota archaeon]|nr:hypothetical protein [Nanoarchaeota archaeon]
TYSSGITTIYNETLLYEYEWFVKPYGSNEFDSCSDFLWCDNNGNDILAHGNTEPGDEWLCEVTPIDWRGVGQGKNSSILHVTAGTGGTSPGQGGPEITYVTHNYDQDNPAIVGQDATISVGWGGEYDYVKLYLCDGNSPYIRNSGCWGYEFNRTTTSVSPINAVFELEEGAYVYNVEDHGPVNYTVILCSDEYDCSNSSDYFYINHLPEIDDLELLYYDGSGYSSGSSTNETQALNCSADVEDIDNDISAYTYKWYVKRSGAWQLYWQEESVISSAVLSASATLPSDIWKCSVQPEDAYSTGTTVESNEISIVSSGGVQSNSSVLNVIDDASKIFPKNTGENISFSVAWQNEGATSMVVYVCDSPNVLKTGCPAGSTEYGFSGWTTSNPVVMNYELVENDYADNTSTKPYYTRVCDNNFDCSNVFSTENTTIGINHLPYAVNVEMLNETNGTYLNVSNHITCNYSFSDMDNDEYNGRGENTSLYREEANVDFAWYKYDSGSWVEQTSYTNQVLVNTFTSLGDRWKCGIVTNDGYTDSPETFSSFRIIGGYGPIIESVISNADDENEPLTKGETLTLSVDWYDPSYEEQIDLYICSGYGVSQGSGCDDETFCEVLNTYTDPINCSLSSSDFDSFSTEFFVTIYDLNGSKSNQSGVVYVNNEPTFIGNVTLNGSTSGEVYPLSSENIICNGEGNDTDNLTGVDYYYYWYRDNGSGFQTYTYPN